MDTSTLIVATLGAPAGADLGFRPEETGLAEQALWALLVTAVVLALFLVVVLHARSRGWLARWQAGGRAPDQGEGSTLLRVEQKLRLGPRTTVFHLSLHGRSYLVVESSSSVQVVPGAAGGEARDV